MFKPRWEYSNNTKSAVKVDGHVLRDLLMPSQQRGDEPKSVSLLAKFKFAKA